MIITYNFYYNKGGIMSKNEKIVNYTLLLKLFFKKEFLKLEKNREIVNRTVFKKR